MRLPETKAEWTAISSSLLAALSAFGFLNERGEANNSAAAQRSCCQELRERVDELLACERRD